MSKFQGSINGQTFDSVDAFIDALKELQNTDFESEDLSIDAGYDKGDIVTWYPGQPGETDKPPVLTDDLIDEYIENIKSNDYDYEFDTELINDEIGKLNPSEVADYLNSISKLSVAVQTHKDTLDGSIEDAEKRRDRLQDEIDDLENTISELEEQADNVEYILKPLEDLRDDVSRRIF